MKTQIKRFYDGCLASLNSRWGIGVFAIITFLNSSLLPLSPYFMLIPMCLSRPRRWILYSLIAVTASILGGYLMWILGFFFWEAFQGFASDHLPLLPVEKVPQIAQQYSGATFWAIVAASVSPVPYKIVALACGLAQVSLWDFTLASIIGRGSRLALTAYLVAYGGPKAQKWIALLTRQKKPDTQKEQR